MRAILCRHAFGFIAILSTIVLGDATSLVAGEAFDGYYNYLGNYPEHETLPWSDDVQGIAHSDDHWYITNGNDEVSGLFKIHVSQDLADGSYSQRTTPGLSGLTAAYPFIKFKALDSYKNPFDGQWYLVIGVEGSNNFGVAVYDESLQLIGADFLNQNSAGWVAIDRDGFLYSSINGNTYMWRYTVDWAAIASGGGVDVSSTRDVIPMQDETGAPLAFSRLQGGAFTPEGDKLYIVTGFFGESTFPHGIHVFDTTISPTYVQRVHKSTQEDDLFRFQWNPACNIPLICEEPEGLTFWDLTDGRAPNIDGELHVLLLDNDASTDEIFLKHYTKGIYIDASQGSGQGDAVSPFPTFQEAIDLAFEDMELRAAAGNYPEILTLSKRLRLVRSSSVGVVTIGP